MDKIDEALNTLFPEKVNIEALIARIQTADHEWADWNELCRLARLGAAVENMEPNTVLRRRPDILEPTKEWQYGEIDHGGCISRTDVNTYRVAPACATAAEALGFRRE